MVEGLGITALLLPTTVLILLTWLVHTYGKDPVGRGTIVPVFHPPGDLSLLETILLRTMELDDQNLAALIVSWAVSGSIRIHEPIRGQIAFEKIKDPLAASPGELSFFRSMFPLNDTVHLSELKNSKSLFMRRTSLGIQTFRALTKKKLFIANPATVVQYYAILGFIVMLLPLFGFFSLNTGLGIFLAGFIICVFSPLMPQRTQIGVHKTDEIRGFKLYLETAERYRMKFAEQEKVFEQYLPYAIAFGVTDRWSDAFKHIGSESPRWYDSYSGNTWSIPAVRSWFSRKLEKNQQ